MQPLRVREGYFRDPDGKPVYLVGANFWPSGTGPWVYRDPWHPNAVGDDLAALASLGANAVRLFCFLPDFLPAPDVVDESACERLASLVELAARAGLWSIPTFLVGHMSGENWAPQWSFGKNWYTDPVLLDASELLIGTIVSRYARDPRIAAWLLTNEWPLFAGQIDRAASTRWATRLIAVVRAADPETNVSTGDGAWDVIGGQTGVPSSACLRDSVDFFGPHFYPKETDALRHSAFAGFAMKMLQPLSKPVLLEEFGCSSDQIDDPLGAAYYRTTLWSAFGSGNAGALAWNSHDFACADRPPYSHHPYELHFGLFRTDGSRKPQADEFARFASFAKSHDAEQWQLDPPHAAIGRTAYYTHDFPFDWGWSKPQMRDLLLQGYGTCVQAGLNVEFVDLASLHSGQPAVLFVPCLWQVTGADVRGLERFARDGGTVYLSYGGEPWFPNLGEFVGARLLIRYGLVADSQSDRILIRFSRDFGGLPEGTSLRFDVKGETRQRAPVRCVPTHGETVARDEQGNPVLLERPLGSGRVIFFTHPVEYYHLHELDSNRDSDLRRLYRAVAERSGWRQAVCDYNPRVQTFAWRNQRSPHLRRVLFINHAWDKTSITLRIGAAIRDAESGEAVADTFELGEKGVRLLETIPEV